MKTALLITVKVLAVLFVISTVLIIRAFVTIKPQVSEYRDYWLARNAKQQPTGSVRYIALGDSAAQGVGASKPERGYVGLLAMAFSSSDRPVHVINLSVSGARLEDVLHNQLPQLKNLNIEDTDIVTLAIGGNDMRDYDKEQFRATFAQIVDELPKQTIVADVSYFGGGRRRQSEPAAVDASSSIAELTRQRSLKLAKLHERTKETDSLSTYAADWFHPSDYGYVAWAEAFLHASRQ